MGVRALIDGDVVIYRIGFACERTVYNVMDTSVSPDDFMYQVASFSKKKDAIGWINGDPTYILVETHNIEPWEIVKLTVDRVLEAIINKTGATLYDIFITDPKHPSFRKELEPEYKANRDSSHKPIYYSRIKNYLITYWNATLARPGLEADDELGIHQYEHSVIVTVDKDLDNIPGLHYNWVKERLYNVSEEQAHRNFWKQMLMGDSVDNIKGLPKVGNKTADKLLDSWDRDKYEENTYKLYKEKGIIDDYRKNYTLLTILRTDWVDEEEPHLVIG